MHLYIYCILYSIKQFLFVLKKSLTITTSVHFPAEMFPKTIFSSKSIQQDKHIYILLKVFSLMETEDTKKILHNKRVPVWQYDLFHDWWILNARIGDSRNLGYDAQSNDLVKYMASVRVCDGYHRNNLWFTI